MAIDMKNVTKVLGAVFSHPSLAPLLAESKNLAERMLATALPLVEAEAVKLAGEAFGDREGPGDVDVTEAGAVASAASTVDVPPHRVPATCVQCGGERVETETGTMARRFCLDCGRIQPRGATA